MAVFIEMGRIVNRIRGHASNFDNGVRVEDVLRTPNNNRRRCGRTIIIALMFGLLAGLAMIYLLVGNLVLDNGYPRIKYVAIENEYANITIINTTTISLEANYRLQVSFKKQVNVIRAYPILGSYNLSMYGTVMYHPISVLASQAFQISENRQAISVRFEVYQTLPEEYVSIFQKRLQDEKVSLALDGDYKMLLKLTTNLPLPRSYQHLKFRCQIQYKAESDQQAQVRRCDF